MPGVYFEKTGTPVWLYYFVGIMQLPILIIYLVNMYSGVNFEDSVDGVLVAISVFVVLMFAGIYWLMAAMKLELRIADRQLSFRFPPFIRKERVFAFEEIEKWEIIKKSFITLGIGLRYDPARKARIYSTGSDHVLSLKLKSGKNIMLTTRQPEELQKMIELAQNPDYE